MTRKSILTSLAFGVLMISGCAHSAMKGSVAMKVSATEAHVCLDNAKVGDRLTLFKNSCPTRDTGLRTSGSSAMCEKVRVGQGTVTQILNQHYSVLKADAGVAIEEGNFVE